MAPGREWTGGKRQESRRLGRGPSDEEGMGQRELGGRTGPGTVNGRGGGGRR